MTKNVGGIDRTLRIVIGLALIAAAATGTIGLWGYVGVASRFVRMATNSSSLTPSCTWMFLARCSATVVSKRTGRSLGG